MDIKKLDRTALKSYFVKNAAPTAANFADMIDGVINQKEDGIAKLAGEPLSLQADGADTSLKKALNFYKNFADSKPAWTLSLNPRVTLADAATAKSGWSVGDADGNSKLFIDQGTGNVGVGTVTPAQRLHVAGNATVNNVFVGDVGHGPTWAGFSHGSSATTTGYGFLHHSTGQYALINKKSGGGYIGLRIDNADKMVLADNGSVGIGTTAPTHLFHVVANEAVGLFESSGGQAYLRLSTREGIDNRVEITNRPGGRLSLWTAGGGDVFNITRAGNVGIGTEVPRAKLEMKGGAIMPAAGNSAAAGIQFPPDPGGGGSDNAWIRYYPRSGEACTLEIGISNDGDDHIALMSSGNVGIGTIEPKAKLDVRGTARVDVLQLGDKWRLSGIGDHEANDEWLRFKNIQNSAYWGGIAASKFWSGTGGFVGSDLRLKTEVSPLRLAAENVMRLRGVRFKWRDGEDKDPCAIGLIAQEVEEIFPEVVTTGPDGMKGVNYAALVAPLIEALKHQQAQLVELRAEVHALKAG